MSAESELITGELPQRQLLKFQDLANWIYTRVRRNETHGTLVFPQ